MTESPLVAAQRLFAQAVEALRGVGGAGSADERVSVLALCEATVRQLDQVTTEWIVRIRDGLPEFIPPKWIDPEQRPRRRALPHLAAAR